MRFLIALTVALLLARSEASGADRAYERRFSDLLATGFLGFVSDPTLVDTNNAGPLLPAAPVAFAGFSKAGDFAGIKLGMTMSEVVAAWGKPRGLYTRCGIGPRFYYGHSMSLFFLDERLVRIVLSDQLLRGLVFDNGLKGTMSSAQVAAAIGSSMVRRNDPDHLTYGFEGLHLDFSFHHVPTTPQSASQAEEVSCVILGRGDERKIAKLGEP
jgi:hypothetical protein